MSSSAMMTGSATHGPVGCPRVRVPRKGVCCGSNYRSDSTVIRPMDAACWRAS